MVVALVGNFSNIVEHQIELPGHLYLISGWTKFAFEKPFDWDPTIRTAAVWMTPAAKSCFDIYV